MPDAGSSASVETCPADARQAACELLFARLGPTARAKRSEHVLQSLDASPERRALMHIGRREGRLQGAVYVELQPGRTAVLTPPRIAPEAPLGLVEQLLRSAIDDARSEGVQLVQCLVPRDAGQDPEMLLSAGFGFLADLVRMSCLASSFPREQPEGELSFEPYAEDRRARLAAVIERTYKGSLDCPSIEGVRSIDDVIEGYRSAGAYDSARWFFVRMSERDVGCLILADHVADDQYELVYMGLAPEARGHGRGRQIVRRAQWLARQAARGQLVLAVDAANRPALATYRRCDFVAWDRRSVFALILES